MADLFIDLPLLAPRQPSGAHAPVGNSPGWLVPATPGVAALDFYLLTRVTVPPVQADALTRSPLIELLERNTPLILLSAGAGYNKTTLLAAGGLIVSIVAGRSYTITLTNQDDNRPGNATYTNYDDVAVS